MSGLYVNGPSMEDRLVEGLVLNLKAITQPNGYENTIGDVLEDPPQPPASIMNHPGIVIVFGEERNTAEDINLQELTVPVFLYCHIRETSTPARAVRSLKRDIQRMLGVNWMLPDAAGVPTCGRAKYASSLPFARVNGAPAHGVRIGLEVTYQQLTQDPTQN